MGGDSLSRNGDRALVVASSGIASLFRQGGSRAIPPGATWRRRAVPRMAFHGEIGLDRGLMDASIVCAIGVALSLKWTACASQLRDPFLVGGDVAYADAELLTRVRLSPSRALPPSRRRLRGVPPPRDASSIPPTHATVLSYRFPHRRSRRRARWRRFRPSWLLS